MATTLRTSTKIPHRTKKGKNKIKQSKATIKQTKGLTFWSTWKGRQKERQIPKEVHVADINKTFRKDKILFKTINALRKGKLK